jgi:hypothetical protein
MSLSSNVEKSRACQANLSKRPNTALTAVLLIQLQFLLSQIGLSWRLQKSRVGIGFRLLFVSIKTAITLYSFDILLNKCESESF